MFRRANDLDMNSSFDGNNNVVENEMNIDINMNQGGQDNMMNQIGGQQMNGGCCNPITEAVQERCVHRTIVHEVPHV